MDQQADIIDVLMVVTFTAGEFHQDKNQSVHSSQA